MSGASRERDVPPEEKHLVAGVRHGVKRLGEHGARTGEGSRNELDDGDDAVGDEREDDEPAGFGTGHAAESVALAARGESLASHR